MNSDTPEQEQLDGGGPAWMLITEMWNLLRYTHGGHRAKLAASKRIDEALREAYEAGRAEGRLQEFYRMKKERPIDPAYWDMHEETRLKEAVGVRLSPSPAEPSK